MSVVATATKRVRSMMKSRVLVPPRVGANEVVEVRHGVPCDICTLRATLDPVQELRSRTRVGASVMGDSMSTSVSRSIIVGTSWPVHRNGGRRAPPPELAPPS